MPLFSRSSKKKSSSHKNKDSSSSRHKSSRSKHKPPENPLPVEEEAEDEDDEEDKDDDEDDEGNNDEDSDDSDESEDAPPLGAETWRFWFTAHEIGPNEDVPRRHDNHGGWMPSKAAGSNLRKHKGDHDQRVFKVSSQGCESVGLEELAQEMQMRRIETYSRVSVYFDRRRSRFWCVGKDVTDRDPDNAQVGDGLDDEFIASDDSDSNDRSSDLEDWLPLNFIWGQGGDPWYAGHSTADISRSNDTLHCTRQGQGWPSALLPPNYLPSLGQSDALNRRPPYGSLSGDIALLLALLAHTVSASDDHLTNVFEACIRSNIWSDVFLGWFAPLPNPNHPPWRRKRGIVIKVWIPRDSPGVMESRNIAESFKYRPVFL